MHKFKIGDKVRIIKSRLQTRRMDDIGKSFTIRTIYDNGQYGDVAYGSSDGDDTMFVWYDDELELMPQKKFKRGDKVKIPTTKSVGDSLKNSVAIRHAIKKGQDYLYVTGYRHGRVLAWHEDYPTGDYFAESDLELYEEEIQAKLVTKYKVGDRVVVKTNKDSCNGKTKHNGKMATIVRDRSSWNSNYKYALSFEDGFLYSDDELELYDDLAKHNGTFTDSRGFTVIVNYPAVIVIGSMEVNGKSYSDIKSVAKCMPEDKFDPQFGYELAMSKWYAKVWDKHVKYLTK